MPSLTVREATHEASKQRISGVCNSVKESEARSLVHQGKALECLLTNQESGVTRERKAHTQETSGRIRQEGQGAIASLSTQARVWLQ